MKLLELVRKCQHCSSDMTDKVSPRAYLENPFCASCFGDRLKSAQDELGPVRNVLMGHYLAAIPLNQKTP